MLSCDGQLLIKILSNVIVMSTWLIDSLVILNHALTYTHCTSYFTNFNFKTTFFQSTIFFINDIQCFKQVLSINICPFTQCIPQMKVFFWFSFCGANVLEYIGLVITKHNEICQRSFVIFPPHLLFFSNSCFTIKCSVWIEKISKMVINKTFIIK